MDEAEDEEPPAEGPPNGMSDLDVRHTLRRCAGGTTLSLLFFFNFRPDLTLANLTLPFLGPTTLQWLRSKQTADADDQGADGADKKKKKAAAEDDDEDEDDDRPVDESELG